MVDCYLSRDGTKKISVVPKKINDYTYIVEKQEGMNVPVKIFADEILMKKMLDDQCICQGVHVATLPGIKGFSIMMPDAHQGYGFSIGGVAAIDAENGCISPGGVGFDINCTHPDARTSLQYGTWLSIKELEQHWDALNLAFADKNNGIKNTNLAAFMKRPHVGNLFEIKLATGNSIKVTGEHPICTKEGMKKAEAITVADDILVHPFRGVKYEEPSNEVIVTEKDVESVLEKIGVTNRGNAKQQVMKQLKKLLPLRYNSPEIPILLKLLGFIFGDGVLYFTQKKGNIQFYGNEEDLLDIKKDIESIGFKGGNIYKRDREHEIHTHYGVRRFSREEVRLQKKSTAFAALLVALSCPYGSKTHQEYRMPLWIMHAPLWQKRLFLSSFFGAELSRPDTLNKYNFYGQQLNMNKLETLKDSAVDFLNDVRELLKQFGVQSRPPVIVPGYTYEGKRGKTIGLRVQIPANPQNHLLFLERVSYEYHREKKKLACLAAAYLRMKQGILAHRQRVRSLSRIMYAYNYPVQKIVSDLNGEFTSKQFVKHSLWSERSEDVRVPPTFPSFEEYCEAYAVGDDGLVWAEIESIQEVPYDGYVYDVTMNDENHNFIADNFVVSNCGVRLLQTNLTKEEVKPKMKELLDALFTYVPPGVGRKANVKLTEDDLDDVLRNGAKWAVAHGYGTKEDLEHCEESGTMPGADPKKVSKSAHDRGIGQLGTLGSGNHFLEVQYVAKIHDKKTAEVFGIQKEGQVVVMIHCGSRGLGHQVCSDYLRKIEDTYPDIVASLPEKDLAYAPAGSPLANDYFGGMCAAANFAWANRHIIGHQVRKAFTDIFGERAELHTVYDVAHNIAKLEEHVFDGETCKVWVHRKGATRAFGHGRKEVPEKYRAYGQPILIPGSMGTSSFVLVGTDHAMMESFGSTAHGAGRTMSRHEALRRWRGEDIKRELEKEGILIRATSWKGISEEAPLAYKDVDEVVDVSDKAGIGTLVAQLKPMGVVKG